MKTGKQRTFSPITRAAIVAIFGVIVAFTACDNGTTPTGNPDETPTAADFDISGTGSFTYDGNPKTVTVTAKTGKTSGTVTVKYNGNATAPSAVGAYTVTFDVAAATGWNSASGLSAGTLTIIAADPNNQTPTAADFDISGTGTFTYDGNPKTVTVTAKTGKTSGTITVKYNGNATATSAVGTYTVTFDVAAATGWNSVSELSAGTLTIIREGQPPTIIDNISDLSSYLSGQPANTKDTPYYIALKITDDSEFETLRTTLNNATNKYVSLDLSGSTITSIGEYAFYRCESLTSVTIRSGVISIGMGAFDGCRSLTSVTIGNSVTEIGGSAFHSCESLTVINVAAANTAYCSVDGVLYNKDQTILYTYPRGKTDVSYTIPNSVTSIGNYAFSSCTNLTGITIPNSVTSIGGSAFSYCIRFTSITIPDSVTSIGERGFNSCYDLTSVTIPNSVTSIGEMAFYGCTSLANVIIPNSVTSIGEAAFSYCTSLTTINVDSGNSFFSSDQGVLYNKDKTTLVMYPGGKTGAFTIPNSVTSIGEMAFYGCTSLTSVTIPDSVISIKYEAFARCTGLTNVTFQGTIASGNFSNFAFYGDLRDKFYATDATNGTPGTYTTTAPVGESSVWVKQ